MAATADQHRLQIVVDPNDDLDTLRAARALHARPFGQIVCDLNPTSDTEALAHHLLDALGKTTSTAPNAWWRAGALLAGERIDHLVLLPAHLLSYPALRRLADCTAASDTQLWLLSAGELPTLRSAASCPPCSPKPALEDSGGQARHAVVAHPATGGSDAELGNAVTVSRLDMRWCGQLLSN